MTGMAILVDAKTLFKVGLVGVIVVAGVTIVAYRKAEKLIERGKKAYLN